MAIRPHVANKSRLCTHAKQAGIEGGGIHGERSFIGDAMNNPKLDLWPLLECGDESSHPEWNGKSRTQR